MVQKIWRTRSMKNEVTDKIVDRIAEAKHARKKLPMLRSNGAN
jgi:hypothetical protein